MKIKTLIPILFLALSSLILAACGSAAAQNVNDPTAVPIVDDFNVVAEGRLVPKESIQLSFVTAGQVAEILVQEGQAVKAGDVLARLGEREPLEASLSGTELELLTSKLELSAARLEQLNAQKTYDDLYENWPAQATLAQQDLNDARQAVHDTERNLNYLSGTAAQFDVDAAWSQVVLAKDVLEDAEEKFEPYANKPEDNLTRAAYQSRFALAQKSYDAAVRNYNATKGTANAFDISQAEASYRIAQARLAQAQKDYDELVDGPDPDEVALAEAAIEAAQRRVSAGEGRIASAQANIAAAQAALQDMELTAAFDGTIVNLDLIVGEQVSPGAPVAVLADFSQWYVETDNLTEIEVVDVTESQPVTIEPDALPEVVLSGHVDRIEDIFEEKRGDITYTARILVDEMDPRLRWGMTVVV
ncbi:MAG: efflux RND transporter periplasmic adaptor subunit, partial [Anaerolineales bacterium]|nr:efflux RND transporter periplasmic adaptor subunit [Anaerolineales bacterium]